MRLLDVNGKEVKVGDEVTTFRGEKVTLVDFTPPFAPPSTGLVTIKFYDDSIGYYYPSVINCSIQP